jgi:uncharacterized protein YdcH (DUF465 family)
MSNMLDAYLKSLRDKHKHLDRAIDRGTSVSGELQHLKRLRLRLRDEIVRLRQRSARTSH